MAVRTAVGAYRALMRAQRDLFLNDAASRATARAETRSAFMANAAAKPEDVPAMIEDAHETALFIRSNVAQAELNDRGHYGRPITTQRPCNSTFLNCACTVRLSLYILAVLGSAQCAATAYSPRHWYPAAAPLQRGFQQVMVIALALESLFVILPQGQFRMQLV